MPLEPMLPDPDYHAMRLVWCDSAGIRRCRVVPSSSASDHGVGLTKACMAAPAYQDCCVPGSGLGPIGEVRLVADEAALVPVLPWHPSHGMTIANMTEGSGKPWCCCPREALRRTLRLLEQRHGLTLQVGFESEFVLLKHLPAPDSHGAYPDINPVDSSVYAETRSLDAQAEVLDIVAQALESMGIGVLQYHAESAPGQFEVVTTHFPALEACDKLLMTRETICGVVRRQTSLAVSFMPKCSPVAAGSGCHMHLSLQKDGRNVMLRPDQRTSQAGTPTDYPQLSDAASAFLAGVLHHLPALLMFTCPSIFSYARLRPSTWSGAFTVWGWDNREASLRMTSPPGGPANANAEYKSMDATANPHIALAALVTAGMLGLSGGLVLPPPVQVDPNTMFPGARLAAGVQPLPVSLHKAIDACAEDVQFQAALLDTLGAPLLKAFTAVRVVEADHKLAPKMQQMLTRY